MTWTKGASSKGVSFVNIRDAGDPAELASFYNSEGADELVFLDITASSDAREIILGVVEQVSEEVFIPLTVGGGLRRLEDVRRMLEAGADKVSLNTAAVANPRLVAEAADFFGSQCIVVAMDVKRVADGERAEAAGRAGDSEIGCGPGVGLGGLHPRGPHTHRNRRAEVGAAAPPSLAQGSFSSPAWTPTASLRATTWR